jgi:16S rRNA (guanine1207-N2)-methyltransferase
MWDETSIETMTDETADLDLLLAAFPPAEGARALFANAAPHPALSKWRGRIDCVQPWKPTADALGKQDMRIVAAPEGPYDLAFVRLQRQRERHLGDLARALDALRPGGSIAVCGPNAMGGARLIDDLRAMGVAGAASSKSKCRLVVATRPAGLDLARWTALDAPRHVAAIDATSAPGLFAWDRLDPGSALLLDLLPKLSGKIADLGAGWGALARKLSAQIDAPIDAYEADARAIECLRINVPGARALWHDATTGLSGGPYDAIVANLPFHDPRGENRALAEKFARVARAALAPGGRFFAVANVHLPYEITLDAVFGRVERLGERDGYKTFAAYAAANTGPSTRANAPGTSSTPKNRARSTGPANAALPMRARSKPKRA